MIFAHLPVLSVLVPLVGALLLLPAHHVWKKLVFPLTLITAIASLATSLSLALEVRRTGAISYHLGGWPPPFGIELAVDHFSAMMVVLISSLQLLVLVYAKRGLGRALESRRHFFFSLYLLLGVGLIGMSVTGDLFNLYVFLEVVALTSYALVAVGERPAPIAAFRYLIIGTLGAMFYLLGVAHVYGLTGSLNYADVAERLAALPKGSSVSVAVGFMLVGFAIKAALFPLHAWLPDAYTYAPNVTTALLGAVGIKIGAYGIYRILFTVLRADQDLALVPVVETLGMLAAVAIIVGSVLAIAQTDLKRMLAYSSISQIGYVLLGFSMMNASALTGAVLHIINHALMKSCLFLTTGAIQARLGHRDIRHLSGVGKALPISMASFTVAAISMIGLPPTAGFFSKWYLVLGAVEGDHWLYVLVILGSSLLTAVYFFRVIEVAYLRALADPKTQLEPADGPAHAPEFTSRLPASMLVPLGVAAFAILAVGLGSWELVEHFIVYIVPGGF